MEVWIDQDLCTGEGLCEEICPQVFVLLAGTWPTSERVTGSWRIPAAQKVWRTGRRRS